MFTYKTPKLSQHTRQQIFNQYQERVVKTNSKSQLISPKRKYTQAALALDFGVSRQTISKIIHAYRQSKTIRRPQTNGKVERLNRTIAEEFLTKTHFENRSRREVQLRLWEYHYNHHRPHQGINKMTPNEKFNNLFPLKFMLGM